jgi:hypothetical protein
VPVRDAALAPSAVIEALERSTGAMRDSAPGRGFPLQEWLRLEVS